MTTKNSYRSHVVEEAIARVLAGKGITDESVAEDVMVALEELRIVSYQRLETDSNSGDGRVIATCRSI